MCIDAGCCPAEKYVESHKVTRIHSGIYLQTLAAGGSEQSIQELMNLTFQLSEEECVIVA